MNKCLGNIFLLYTFYYYDKNLNGCIYVIYRVPSKSDNIRRAQWIAAIEEHQRFDANRNIFNVCRKHFDTSNFYLRGKERVLKLNAVPSIFNETSMKSTPTSSPNNDLKHHQTNNSKEQNATLEKCNSLQAKVAELEKEILCMKIQHDIEIQNMKIKFEKSHQVQSNHLKETKKELSKQKSQVIRLEDVVKELREQRFISPDDAKFLNVSSKYYANEFL